MKKLILILFAVLLNTMLFSCTPEPLTDNRNEIQLIKYDNKKECCGGGQNIP